MRTKRNRLTDKLSNLSRKIFFFEEAHDAWKKEEYGYSLFIFFFGLFMASFVGALAVGILFNAVVALLKLDIRSALPIIGSVLGGIIVLGGIFYIAVLNDGQGSE